MNKNHRNIISILLIMIATLFLFSYWLDLSFDYVHIALLMVGCYAIFLNFKEVKKIRDKYKRLG